jgi:Na+-transporting NADH:ubiquinone oxidoreductase subunit C
MNAYIKMIIFALVLGVLTSGVLMAMNAWTEDRIAENEKVRIQATVLDAFDVDYNINEVADIFDDYVDTAEVKSDGETFVFYLDKNSDLISFEFEGEGLWGPIEGVITLESDFNTIADMAVLVQEETPGLGGRIVEDDILDRFTGAEFPVQFIKDADPNDPTQVDAISGGTATSTAFQEILEYNYEVYKTAWDLYEGGSN